jgi:hypothetical protein
MAAETEKKLDYGAFLADLESKKVALERAIASVRAVMDGGALTANVGDSMAMADGFSSSLMPAGEVPQGAFLGKSIPEAAKLYLAIVKRKQTSREIAEGLKKGGIESKSKSFNAQVHSILDRARKLGTGVFVKLDGYWGLAEWYPSGLRNGVTQKQKRSGDKTKRKTKKRSEAVASEKTVSKNVVPGPISQKKGRPQEEIAALLKGKSGAEVSAQEIALPLGIKVQVAHLLLGKLIKGKRAEKTASGKYRAIAA